MQSHHKFGRATQKALKKAKAGVKVNCLSPLRQLQELPISPQPTSWGTCLVLSAHRATTPLQQQRNCGGIISSEVQSISNSPSPFLYPGFLSSREDGQCVRVLTGEQQIPPGGLPGRTEFEILSTE